MVIFGRSSSYFAFQDVVEVKLSSRSVTSSNYLKSYRACYKIFVQNLEISLDFYENASQNFEKLEMLTVAENSLYLPSWPLIDLFLLRFTFYETTV